MTQIREEQMIRDRKTPYLCPCANTHYPLLPAEPSNVISSAVFIQHAGLLFLLRGEEEHKWAYYYSTANLFPQCRKQSPSHCQLMFIGGWLFVPANYVFVIYIYYVPNHCTSHSAKHSQQFIILVHLKLLTTLMIISDLFTSLWMVDKTNKSSLKIYSGCK